MSAVPPLRPAEVRRILRELEPLSAERRIILVGGQAVAFWASFLGVERGDEERLFTSKDIDFEGAARSARKAGELLGGEVRISSIDDHTPNTGIVLFKDSEGTDRELDFIAAPYGLDGRDVRDTAIRLEIADGRRGRVFVWIMHPERCMESRVYNVVGLKESGPIAMDQLTRSVSCAKEFSRRLLAADQGRAADRVRDVLRLNERIYRKCLSDKAFRKLYLDFGVDPFEAVLTDARLPAKFCERRHSQMVATLEKRRRRARAQRERYRRHRDRAARRGGASAR